MSMIGQDRSTSGFALSMGTGLAMETLFAPTDAVYDNTRVFEKFDTSQVDVLIVSWYTIVRNLIQSLSATDRARVFETNKVKEVTAIANSELQVIDMLCNGAGIRLLVLAPNYIKDRLILVDTTKPTSKNMIFRIAIRSKDKSVIKTIEKLPYDSEGETILFSHIAMDLANANQRLTLCLESNTGKVLRPPQFNKKIRKSVLDTSFLPLHPELLAIFGDSSGLLRTASVKDKRRAIELLKAGKVTTSSTARRVKSILSSDPDIRDVLTMNRMNNFT